MASFAVAGVFMYVRVRVRTALATRTVFTKEIDRSENQRYEDVNEANREHKIKIEKEASISSVAILKKVPRTRREFILSNVLKRQPNDMATSVKESHFLSLPVMLIILVISTITVIVIIVTVAALITKVIQIKPCQQPIFMVCNVFQLQRR